MGKLCTEDIVRFACKLKEMREENEEEKAGYDEPYVFFGVVEETRSMYRRWSGGSKQLDTEHMAPLLLKPTLDPEGFFSLSLERGRASENSLAGASPSFSFFLRPSFFSCYVFLSSPACIHRSYFSLVSFMGENIDDDETKLEKEKRRKRERARGKENTSRHLVILRMWLSSGATWSTWSSFIQTSSKVFGRLLFYIQPSVLFYSLSLSLSSFSSSITFSLLDHFCFASQSYTSQHPLSFFCLLRKHYVWRTSDTLHYNTHTDSLTKSHVFLEFEQYAQAENNGFVS